MNTTLTGDIETAIRDGRDLIPWIEQNTVAYEDPGIERAVLNALDGPVAPELASGVPLLRHANTDVPAYPLVEAVIFHTRHSATFCDICGSSRRSLTDRLLVPAGASVVAIHFCWLCKASVDRACAGSSLRWD